MTEPTAPPKFHEPDRLTLVPEHLISQAVANISALVAYDTETGDAVVRWVLAALRLAPPDMPETPAYHYPDGSPTLDSMFAMSGYVCQWGVLRRTGDVAMCALDESYPSGTPGPGHTTPGEHGYRQSDADECSADDHVAFRESDPRTFHAPTWMGESRRSTDTTSPLEES